MTLAVRPVGMQTRSGSDIRRPVVWLGQSVRTTVVTHRYPAFAKACWMVSLGDAIHRPRLIDRVFCGDLKGRLGTNGPIMLDPGGFTMLMQKRGLPLHEVARIYTRTCADICISHDLPPKSGDDRRARQTKYRTTLDHYTFLCGVLGPHRLAPVVHGINLDEAERNCRAIQKISSDPGMVCLGGLVPLFRSGPKNHSQTPNSFVSLLIALVRAHFPKSLIHVLGAGSPLNVANLFRSGADSTDSLAWRRAAGYGTIFLPGTSERFIAPRARKRENSRKILSPAECEVLMRCECPACSEHSRFENRIRELSISYLARAAHNAFVVLAEATP